jgi:uncharacterized protein (TIGR02265 family)
MPFSDVQTFAEPSWHAPLDVAATMRSIPVEATMAGMFFEPMVREAARCGAQLPSARDRYVRFQFYPMREFAQLAAEAAPVLFPNKSLRIGLRKIGRAAPQAMIASTIGKVTLGSAEGVHALIHAMVTTYPIYVRPCNAQVLETKEGLAIVRLQDIHYYLDCHHVGVFEGVMRHAGVRGKVTIRMQGPAAADFRCTW